MKIPLGEVIDSDDPDKPQHHEASMDMFVGAKLKIQWANRHIQQLNAVLNAFIKSDFYSLTNEFDAQAGYYRISVESKALPPADIPLLIGDAIHNLRSALDHVAAAVVDINSTTIYFPFHETRQNHIAADGTLRGHADTIEKAQPGLGRFIVDEIRPHADGDGNRILWVLTKLDAIDKHRLLVPVISLTSVTAYDLYDEANNNSISVLCGTVGAGGAVNLVGSDGQFKIRGKIEPTFSILFGPGTFLEDKPVVETLANLSQAVSETLRSIEEFIATAQKPGSEI